MKLAIIHYHLNRSGVTQVIANHLRALDAVLPPGAGCEVAVLYGGRRQGWPDQLAGQLATVRAGLQVVPLLEYDARRGAPATPQQLAAAVREALDRLDFPPGQTILHVHNHALGKNVALPEAVAELARAGFALVLQMHDFAEDYRPVNFHGFGQLYDGQPPAAWHGKLYPQAPHIHYAVLNGRDAGVLRAAGVDPERIHLLPNPVLDLGPMPPAEEARRKLQRQFHVAAGQRLLLYPVRGIRRKNVGEALLYSATAPAGTVVGLTLPALSPLEVPVYERWKAFAARCQLPFLFELGGPGGLHFTENLAAADLVLTTSVAEGFGMAFLESWLAGRVLVGRDLPEITADFVRSGVRLDHLRPQFLVPLDWVGREVFCRVVREAYRHTLASYGRQPAAADELLESKIAGGLVDFADLGEAQQEEVIRMVADDPARKLEVLRLNPWLAGLPFSDQAGQALIEHNRAAIRRHYALEPSGRRLVRLYQRVLASPHAPPEPLPCPERILDEFLSLGRFRLIRSTYGVGPQIAAPPSWP